MKAEWFVLYIKEGYHKKIANSLYKKKIESYFPITKNNTVAKSPAKGLFVSYLFVKTTAVQLKEVSKLQGVINCLYWLDSPATVEDGEIETLKLFLNSYTNIYFKKTGITDTLASGRNISINSTETIHSSINRQVVELHIPSLGVMLYGEVQKALNIDYSTRFLNVKGLNVASTSESVSNKTALAK
jgi:hypothetical protein